MRNGKMPGGTGRGTVYRAPTARNAATWRRPDRIGIDSVAARLGEFPSASSGRLQPPDNSAPGGDFAGAHGRLQPHDQFVPGNGPAARAVYSGLRHADKRN